MPDFFRLDLTLKPIIDPVVVYGTPVTQGDHSLGFSRRRRVFIRHKNGKRLESWRDVVAFTVKQAMKKADVEPESGAVEIDIDFFYPRPKNHFTAKGARSSKFRTFKTSPPDGDKLQRAIFDALSGVAYTDDRCVVKSVWTKSYQDVLTPGAVIKIYRIEAEF